MQTKTKQNGSKTGRKGPTPDLLGTIKRGPGRPRKRPTRTAEQIADSLEKEAQRLQKIADDLRGKA